MTLKLLMLSWISALMPPSDCRLFRFLLFTHPEINLREYQNAGRRQQGGNAQPDIQHQEKLAAPAIMKRFPAS